MSLHQEVDAILGRFEESPWVSAVFVLSDQGHVERSVPIKKKTQIESWAVVIHPFLQKILVMGRVRSLMVRFRQGNLCAWSLTRSTLLVMITSSDIPLDHLLKHTEPQVISLRSVYNDQGNTETLLGDQLQSLLFQASDHLKKEASSGDGFYGSFRTLSSHYFGKVGEEWVDQGLEELWISLPIAQKRDMEQLLVAVKKRISHPIKRVAFEREVKKLITHFQKE